MGICGWVREDRIEWGREYGISEGVMIEGSGKSRCGIFKTEREQPTYFSHRYQWTRWAQSSQVQGYGSNPYYSGYENLEMKRDKVYGVSFEQDSIGYR